MSKKQKRYSKQYEIEAEIISTKRKVRLCLQEAAQMEDSSFRHFQKSNDSSLTAGDREFMRDQGREMKHKSEMLSKRAHMYLEDRIPSLVRTLATFKTPSLPGFEGDGGVVRQP